MKLQNKETGEIRPAEAREDGIYLYDEITEQWYKYELPLLAEWWGYYEEPKTHWNITSLGDVIDGIDKCSTETIDEVKQIGNYFDTREEAELAIRKLKAWKRLKDKGFRFNRWMIPEEPKTPHIKLVIEAEMDVPDSPYDLELLFGGEE